MIGPWVMAGGVAIGGVLMRLLQTPNPHPVYIPVAEVISLMCGGFVFCIGLGMTVVELKFAT
jgi:hypothetical protein